MVKRVRIQQCHCMLYYVRMKFIGALGETFSLHLTHSIHSEPLSSSYTYSGQWGAVKAVGACVCLCGLFLGQNPLVGPGI